MTITIRSTNRSNKEALKWPRMNGLEIIYEK
jgi:hypothetical protein